MIRAGAAAAVAVALTTLVASSAGASLAGASLAGASSAGASAAGASVAGGYAVSNRWSGYVVQERGLRFDRVSASWRVPGASCTSSQPGAALAWVGLGGADEARLEQVGTQTGCGPPSKAGPGLAYSAAWWEILPLPQQYLARSINPGDLVRASVTLAGRLVTMRLTDVTEGWTSITRRRPRTVTTSSADWIVEDPASCPGQLITPNCPEAPFAEYKPVTFTSAEAGTTSGLAGPITDPHWFALKYGLIARRRLLSWPSMLNAQGTGFSVSRTDRRPPPEPPPPV
jgi:hypothetical protein